MVTAGTLLYFLGVGSVFYKFNAFFNLMMAEFGWSRAVASGAYALSRAPRWVFPSTRAPKASRLWRPRGAAGLAP